MAAADIDSLQISIETSSEKAVEKLNGLVTALSNLKSAAKGGAGLSPIARQIQALVTATNGASSASKKVAQMINALKGLSSVKIPDRLSSVANQLNKLKESVSGLDGTTFSSKMNAVYDSLQKISSLASIRISSSIANQISALNKAVSEIKWTDGDKLAGLANG